jgi:hypothetical protein
MSPLTLVRALVIGALFLGVACKDKKADQGPAMPDLGSPGCIATPTSATELLNACTNAQAGDAAKDYPYFPALAPAGALPPLP